MENTSNCILRLHEACSNWLDGLGKILPEKNAEISIKIFFPSKYDFLFFFDNALFIGTYPLMLNYVVFFFSVDPKVTTIPLQPAHSLFIVRMVESQIRARFVCIGRFHI